MPGQINYPKYIAGMKAKPPYTSSCYGYMYLLHHGRCPVRCDLRPMCKSKSKINKLKEVKENENKRRKI